MCRGTRGREQPSPVCRSRLYQEPSLDKSDVVDVMSGVIVVE
jgi:hypothetical protein